MTQRIAIVDGIRTPFCKIGGPLARLTADDLGAFAVKELLARTPVPHHIFDELIAGNVAQPIEAANVARVIALKAGLPTSLIASSVHRNCASGMEAITSAALRIRAGEGEAFIAVGTESMSNIPLIVSKPMTALFGRLLRARSAWQKLVVWSGLRPSYLMPIIGVQQGLTDPVCGLNMGQTAEILSREFAVTREEQDRFALRSHQRAAAARARLAEEIAPLPLPPDYTVVQQVDDGIRENQDLAALAKLKPYFDKVAGTVTVGNSCPLTDGAAALLVMSEAKALSLGLKPLGYLTGWAYAALDGRRMGLGPVYATSKLLQKTGQPLGEFDLIEINEAFSAQVLACQRAFASDAFAREHLGRDARLGEISDDILNVNGGAVALGHPVGASGARLVLTVLKELRRRGKRRGLATLCIGGGQGAALALEVAS